MSRGGTTDAGEEPPMSRGGTTDVPGRKIAISSLEACVFSSVTIYNLITLQNQQQQARGVVALFGPSRCS